MALRKRLVHVSRTRQLHRSRRAQKPYPTVALVGYTNSGKSTLMNCLTTASVLVENRLFATLDPTVRLLRLPLGGEVMLIDTVGFIHKLPHGFIDAFKSTLEEVRGAQLLLHVVDGSDPHAAEQMAVVENVLAELGVGSSPRITVFNKRDLFVVPGPRSLAAGLCCSVSARLGEGIEQLLQQIETTVMLQQERLRIRIPLNRADLLATLHQTGRVANQSVQDGEFEVIAYVSAKVAGQVRKALAAVEQSTVESRQER